MPRTRNDRRPFRILTLLVLTSICALPAVQATAQDPPAAVDVESIHEELRALKKSVQDAFNRAGQSGKREDFEGVLEWVHDDVVLVAMNGDTVVGKQGIVAYFERMMTGANRRVRSVQHEFEVAELTTLHGDDTGVAHGTTTGRYELAGGMTFDIDANWTATMVNEDGRWQLASFQFGPSIFDNAVLSQAMRSLYWGIGIAGGLGLIVGFLLGRWTGRRRLAS